MIHHLLSPTHQWAPCSWYPGPCFGERWPQHTPPCRCRSSVTPPGWGDLSPSARQPGYKPTTGGRQRKENTVKWIDWQALMHRIGKLKWRHYNSSKLPHGMVLVAIWGHNEFSPKCISNCIHTVQCKKDRKTTPFKQQWGKACGTHSQHNSLICFLSSYCFHDETVTVFKFLL